MKPAVHNLVQDADGGAGAAGCVPLPRGMSGGLCPSAGLHQPGAGLGTRRAPLPAPTLTPLVSAIYSEVYFLYQTPSPAQQELSPGTGDPAPWTAAPAAPRLCPAVVLQCWEGAGTLQSPWGLGCAGGGVILFCSLEMPPMCVPLQLGLDGGVFSIWPERGLPNESQVNNTFFKKNLFKCQH